MSEYDNTEKGGKKSSDLGGVFHMTEGQYDFRYQSGSKLNRQNKYNDTLRPMEDII